MLKPLSPEERAQPHASYYNLPMPDLLPEIYDRFHKDTME